MHPSMDIQQPNQTLIEAAEVISPRILENNNEKQISVDPISLNESSAYSQFVIPPLPAPPSNKFLSCSSLPNSASSSPKLSRKKWRNQNQSSLLSTNNPLARQHSVALANLERLKENHLRRSKSCGEGRASVPPEEFDMWFAKPSIKQVVGKFSGPETKDDDEKFKCGALCLFIPGFGSKAKPVKARKEETVETIISRTVSLEKFECGSWASSAIIGDESESEAASTHHFFDLPMELIRCKSVNDMHSPVSTAFVFDHKSPSPKGVLKNGGGASSRKSTRHVRFSTSSPTSSPASPTSCITPRLRKAREEFNAFLEAQGA